MLAFVDLNERVPPNHPVRAIKQFADVATSTFPGPARLARVVGSSHRHDAVTSPLVRTLARQRMIPQAPLLRRAASARAVVGWRQPGVLESDRGANQRRAAAGVPRQSLRPYASNG